MGYSSAKANEARWRGAVIGSLAILASMAPVHAVDGDGSFMTQAEIRRDLVGQEMRGYYRTGERWIDDYAPDGGIRYVDANNRWTGQWSFQSDVFCTYYNDGADGGCYLLRKISRNCYEYVIVPDSWSERSVPEGMSSEWFARGWAHDSPSTCEDPLLS